MSASSMPSLSPTRPLSRTGFTTLLNSAITANEWRYARRLATAWLAAFPGDLPVKLAYAQAIVQDNHLHSANQAITVLTEICAHDPEMLPAQELLSTLQREDGQEAHFISKGCALVLDARPGMLVNKGEVAPIWSRQLREARLSLAKYHAGDRASLDKAEYAVHQALVENPQTPLAAVVHLRVMAAKNELPTAAIISLAQIYHERWPECLPFTLTLADRLMTSGDSAQAVELLHQAVVKDITGQVPARLWGTRHPYRTLWPEALEIQASSPNSPQNLPVPASVAALLGWNQIPSRIPDMPAIPVTAPAAVLTTSIPAVVEETHPAEAIVPPQPVVKSIPVHRKSNAKNLSEPTRAVQNEFIRLAKTLNNPGIAHQDGRFPVYVVLTTRKGLEAQYGADGAALLDDELKKLVRAMRGKRINHETWGAILFYADDSEYTAFFEMKPVPHNDPWALKLLLADLDIALGKGGERIGAVMIAGGPEIVPFHRLPNPVDDADNEVLSDNPYASLDENYFIQEWPIGRLPGGCTKDTKGLVAMLRDLTRRYAAIKTSQPWYKRIITLVRQAIAARKRHLQSSFGYTAAIWRRAALSVYRIIGDPQNLLVSPPVHACGGEQAALQTDGSAEEAGDSSNCILLPKARLAYFNLHGIPDSAFWYGHRDPTEPLPGVEFPVALRPQDVRNSGNAPQLVFSEACYGTYLNGKSLEDALSLKFLSAGTQAVIGSTCISYGSLATPLSAADLLGRVFWNLIEEGFSAGEALRRAKLHMVREMHRRQGYLDPEDQKTLISFVLYGDPLAQPNPPRRNPKSLYRRTDLPHAIQTVSENPQANQAPLPISSDLVSHVKSIVNQYLPGMTDASYHLTQSHTDLADLTPDIPDDNQQSPGALPHLAGRRVVTLSKTIQQEHQAHEQFARLTLDASGKLLKLTVSR